jgi:cytochrome d ubiquinol oxidase subunit I
MVGIGVLMMLTGLWSLWQRFRGRLYDNDWLLRLAVLLGPSGFAAVLAGWITTEVGRQPYTVYGLLRTAQSVSPIDAQAVGASLIAFIVVYFAVFGAGILYILRLMAHAPQLDEPDIEKDMPLRAAGVTPGPALELAQGQRRSGSGGG